MLSSALSAMRDSKIRKLAEVEVGNSQIIEYFRQVIASSGSKELVQVTGSHVT
jgi:hypothetical protein